MVTCGLPLKGWLDFTADSRKKNIVEHSINGQHELNRPTFLT